MSRVLLTIAMLLVIVGILACYLVPAQQFINSDVYAYSEAAQHLLQGERLYEGSWQDKPPLAILYYLLPQLVVEHSTIAAYAEFMIWLTLFVAVTHVMLRGVASLTTRWLVSLLWCLLPLTHWDWAWPGAEHLSNLPVYINLLMAYRFLRLNQASAKALLVAGLLMGLGFNLRQSAIFLGTAPLVAAWMVTPEWPRRLRMFGAYVLGGGVAMAAVIGLVACIGSVEGYLETVFVYPKRYASVDDVWVVGSRPVQFGYLFAGPVDYLYVMPSWIILTVIILTDRNCPGRLKLFVLGMNLVGLFTVISPGKPYSHYLVTLFPVFLLGIVVFVENLTDLPRRMRLAVALSMSAYIAARAGGYVGFMIGMPNADVLNQPHPTVYDDVQQMARWIDDHATSDDTLFAYADWRIEPAVYFLTDIRPAHRHFWSTQVNHYWIDAIGDPTLPDQMKQHPPTLLAVYNAVPELERKTLPTGGEIVAHYLANYPFEKQFEVGDWVVYRRRDTQGAP